MCDELAILTKWQCYIVTISIHSHMMLAYLLCQIVEIAETQTQNEILINDSWKLTVEKDVLY